MILTRWRLAALIVLCSVGPSAFALVPPAGVIEPVISPSGKVVTWSGDLNGSWSTNGSGAPSGGASLGKDFSMPGPGGRSATARATVKLTATQLAKAAARAAGYVGAAVWVGSELYDYWQDLRVQGDHANGNLPLHDSGQDTQTITEPRYRFARASYASQFIYKSEGEACQAAVAYSIATLGYANASRYGSSGCLVNVYFGNGNYAGQLTFTLTSQNITVNQCAAYIDFYGNNIGAGEAAPGVDGKCPTGQYEPISPDDLATMRQAYANAWNPGNLNDLMAEILGKVTIPVADTSGVEVGNVVPSALSGPEKVTTKIENGETIEQKEAIGWDWSLDPLRKNEGNWIETKSVFEKDGNGNWQTKSSTTTGGQTDQESALASGDWCKANPDASACRALGEAPEPDMLPTRTVEFEINPVSGFGPSSAACPAPRSISVSHGVTLSMPFDLLCEFADGIRPVVLAMAWIGAVFTFMGVSRREG